MEKEALAAKRKIDSKVLLKVVVVARRNLMTTERRLRKKRKELEALPFTQNVEIWDIGQAATNVLTMEQRKGRESQGRTTLKNGSLLKV